MWKGAVIASLLFARGLPAADCNQNGIEDSLDIAPRHFGFTAAGKLHMLPPPSRALLAQLDGDGDLDLAAISSFSEPSELKVWLNQGHGSLGDPVAFPTPAEQTLLVDGDLDGDGDVDLAISYQGPFGALSPKS